MNSAEAIVDDANRNSHRSRTRSLRVEPPPIENLGNSGGFSFRLQDRGQRGYVAR